MAAHRYRRADSALARGGASAAGNACSEVMPTRDDGPAPA